MKKILLISPDIIGEKMAGPGIRYLNFAEQLSRTCEVTLLVPEHSSINIRKTGYDVDFISAKLLEEKLKLSDAVVIQGITLFKYPIIKESGVPIVVDLYDPFIFENFELRKHLSMNERSAYHRSDLGIINEQLLYGDYFVCASEKQRDFWLGMLSALNRINPEAYDEEINLNSVLGVVPFGIPEEKPAKARKVLKGVHPGIAEDDKLLLWSGGIWNWFDPLTLIAAVNEISKQRNDVKLYFMGTRHPNPEQAETEMMVRAEKLCKELGILDRYVFFSDSWVPYAERQEFLLEADIGVSTYYNNIETRFSFRTRMLDAIWCNLPSIVTRGDYFADIIDAQKIGLTVRERDVQELKDAILRLIEDKALYESCKTNINGIKKDYYWSSAVAPLQNFCMNPKTRGDKPESGEIAATVEVSRFSYYAMRARKLFTKAGMKKLIYYIRRM